MQGQQNNVNDKFTFALSAAGLSALGVDCVVGFLLLLFFWL